MKANDSGESLRKKNSGTVLIENMSVVQNETSQFTILKLSL